jgi:4-amino-4-deoxy-L-arabinose transferase-like glycosyltransferase
MYTTRFVWNSIGFGLIILILTPLLFDSLAIDWDFLLMAFVVISVSSFYYYYAFKNIRRLNFQASIFRVSLLIRIVAVFVYYVIFFNVTDTPFEITSIDSIYYHNGGKKVVEHLSKGDFSLDWMISAYKTVDKIGYQIFLGIIYFFTDDSIIIARLIQGLISAYTVVVAYKIGKLVWGEYRARAIAILFSGFPPFILYSTLHLREFLLVFLSLFMVLYFLRLMQSYKIKYMLWLLLAIIGMFFLRAVFTLIFLAAVTIYFVIFEFSKTRKRWVIVTLFGLFFIILYNFPIFDSAYIKVLGYLGLEDNVRLGGYSQELVVSRGMSLAEYIAGPLFIIPSLPFPMPSILKLSIEKFGQTMHWYFTGGLILWVFFSGFFYRGMYQAIKARKKNAIFIIILILIHSVVLLESFYFTSIRFNQVKMSLLLLFVPAGMHYFKNKESQYIIYLIFMVIIIIGYNYLRIFGRGI